ESQFIDVNEVLHLHLLSGIPYGAVVSRQIDFPYAEVKTFLSKPGGAYQLVSSVKTLRNFDQRPDGSVHMSVKVPVVADFRTEVTHRVHEDPPDRWILEWKQTGDYGDLAYNQGALVAAKDGDRTRVLVIGIHIMKPDHRVPSVG